MPVKTKWKPNRLAIAAVKKSLINNLKAAGEVGLEVARERVSPPAMSRDELDKRGNPYSTRKGGKPLPSPQSKAPDQYIGRASGGIAQSLKGKTKGFSYIIGFESPPSYSKFVFNGTKVMIARSPLAAVRDKEVVEKMLAAFSGGGIK